MITPLKILKRAVEFFEKNKYRYCLIGGHAASLYRIRERFTKDVDFAIAALPLSDSQKLAEDAVRSLGLEPVIGFIPAGPHEKARRSVSMITSKPLKNELTGIIDILLPELPWVEAAVERAQYNKIDLGFSHVPVITPEDLVVAKTYSFTNAPDRFQDPDDLKEIFEGVKELDFEYIKKALVDLDLSIPEPIKKFAPKHLSES